MKFSWSKVKKYFINKSHLDWISWTESFIYELVITNIPYTNSHLFQNERCKSKYCIEKYSHLWVQSACIETQTYYDCYDFVIVPCLCLQSTEFRWKEIHSINYMYIQNPQINVLEIFTMLWRKDLIKIYENFSLEWPQIKAISWKCLLYYIW